MDKVIDGLTISKGGRSTEPPSAGHTILLPPSKDNHTARGLRKYNLLRTRHSSLPT